MGPHSQTQTYHFAGGNASAAGDKTWGTPRAWHGTHFPYSLQKPLPEHVEFHTETKEMHLDQQHPEVSPNRSLQGSIGAEPAQHRNTNTMECAPLPCPHYHPSLWAALLKVKTALSVRLHPTEHTRKDARVHPVQNDRLKHSTNRPMHMDT